MQRPTPRTAENSTPTELWSATIRLVVWFVILGLLVVPMLRELPLGQTGRTAILACLLVGVSLYWLLAGFGYRPLLILQLITFSIAAVLLATKVGLVIIGVERLSILRRVGKGMILLGAASAGLNLIGMIAALLQKFRITISPSSDR